MTDRIPDLGDILAGRVHIDPDAPVTILTTTGQDDLIIDALREALARAHGCDPTSDCDIYEAVDDTTAHRVLDEIVPLVRAQVAEEIATAIEQTPNPAWSRLGTAAMHQAARIARQHATEEDTRG